MRELNWASRWGVMEKPKNNQKPSRFSIQNLHVFSRGKFYAFSVYFHFTHRIAKVAANHFVHEIYIFKCLFDIRGGSIGLPAGDREQTKQWMKNTGNFPSDFPMCVFFKECWKTKKRVEWMHAQRFIFQTIPETERRRRRRRMRPE